MTITKCSGRADRSWIFEASRLPSSTTTRFQDFTDLLRSFISTVEGAETNISEPSASSIKGSEGCGLCSGRSRGTGSSFSEDVMEKMSGICSVDKICCKCPLFLLSTAFEKQMRAEKQARPNNLNLWNSRISRGNRNPKTQNSVAKVSTFWKSLNFYAIVFHTSDPRLK